VPELQHIRVIDTSSIIEVRRRVPHGNQRAVFQKLDELVATGTLVYPIQVVTELEAQYDPKSATPDLPYDWVKRNQKMATRHGYLFDRVREVLQHPQAKFVLDPEKVGTEEADPYILGLALHLKEQGDVTVLTEETRDRPDKLSLNSACGLLRIYCLRIVPFLAQQGIWSASPFA